MFLMPWFEWLWLMWVLAGGVLFGLHCVLRVVNKVIYTLEGSFWVGVF